MSAKRTRDEDAADAGATSTADDTRKSKKAKHGFRVGPENLPDGAWRRKVTKIKKDLITKAKVKKQYAKIKAEHHKQATSTPTTGDDHTAAEGAKEPAEQQNDDDPTAASAQIHPERQAMLDSPSSSSSRPRPRPQHQAVPPDETGDVEQNRTSPSQQEDGGNNRHHRKRTRKQKPDYYSKELAAAERAKKQAEERAAEFARREQERQQRIAERERYRKAMAKAKAPGKDGKPKVGREGKVLLDRVMRMMGEK